MSISRLAICSGQGTAWDVGLAKYNPPQDLSWNVSTTAYIRNLSVAARETNPRHLFFKPDGTKVYFAGGFFIYEYALSTPWVITTATYTRNNNIIASSGLFFKSDGTKMYTIGGTDIVNEYNLSTAWNISTAVFSQSFDVSAQETAPTGLFFKPDGTKMYVLGDTGNDVNEYNLSTAWDVSTSSYSQVFSIATQETSPIALSFKSDGTKMYILGLVGDAVYEYNLSTAWNVTTATYSQSFSIAAQETQPLGLFFKPDGTSMYVAGAVSSAIHEYTLGGFSIAAQEQSPSGLFFKPDGTKMYIVGSAGDEVNEYNLSTPWALSTSVFSQLFSLAAQETFPTGLFFKPDGTKMYIIGSNGDDVNEYNLSTAWDVSTATFVGTFSIANLDAQPSGLFFKPDGTKMYFVGSAADNVNEYNLSTAWNRATAVYSQSFSVGAQGAVPEDLFFKPDGTKMYITGDSRQISEYNLSTAWDISTAVFSQNFSVSAQETSPTGIFFRVDGKAFYVLGPGGRSIFEYSTG